MKLELKKVYNYHKKEMIKVLLKQRMGCLNLIGKSVPRREGKNKVTGTAKYTADYSTPGQLYAVLVTSLHAHAKINSIDITKATKCAGVQAVVTGKDYPVLTGSAVEDRPVLAIEKVRYFGEPVAIVVANSEHEAEKACSDVQVDYELLPVHHSVEDSFTGEKPLIHKSFHLYTKPKNLKPIPERNVANHVTVRKGDYHKGKNTSDVFVKTNVSLPQSDHAAMETRSVKAEILPMGEVHIESSSQAPFDIQQMLSKHFKIDTNKVVVHTPLVGGAFGGKAAIQLEFIAYIASKSTGGKPVKLTHSRENDMISSPVHIGMDSDVKLGATNDGKLTMLEISFKFDSGAYVDEASDITTTAALNCTGPYKVDHVWCDAYCVYTNHPYATSFRGYGHGELAFAIERALDKLAEKLQMDPMELRIKNAIKPGDTTPSQAKLTKGNIGNTKACLERIKKLIDWDEGDVVPVSNNIIRAKGISGLWKTSMSPTDASSGAIITLNKDGSMNLNVGVVEIGQGTKTTLIQLLATSMQVNESKIHMKMDVNTESSPEHWKTVASTAVYMAGNAVLEAAEDVKHQLKNNAAYKLRCKPEALEVGKSKVYLKSNPQKHVNVKSVVRGYKYNNGNTAGNMVIGRGGFVMNQLTDLDLKNGKAFPGPAWTVGAQAVEVEFNTRTFFYTITKAVSVLDAGVIFNPKGARGQVTGAMSMGLSWASREGFYFNENGNIINNQFRTYKILRFDEQPEYIVDFVNTAQLDGPYGARGVGEHGIIGMPAALANSLSKAANTSLNHLPLIPEFIWSEKKEDAP